MDPGPTKICPGIRKHFAYDDDFRRAGFEPA